MSFLPTQLPPHNIPILGFLFVAIHTCVYCVAPPPPLLPAIVSTPLPDARKMGLSGKTFAPHISHKGSLWPITVLMEARDSPQLHAFFPTSCVDGGQGSARPVSVVLSLATAWHPRPAGSSVMVAGVEGDMDLAGEGLLWPSDPQKPGGCCRLRR